MYTILCNSADNTYDEDDTHDSNYDAVDSHGANSDISSNGYEPCSNPKLLCYQGGSS